MGDKVQYVIFGMQGCKPCANAKEYLRVLGIEFEYVDLLESPAAQEYIVNELGLRSVPQIFEVMYDEVDPYMSHLGGYDDLREHLQGNMQ